jgi:GTPase SAR1 family protein
MGHTSVWMTGASAVLFLVDVTSTKSYESVLEKFDVLKAALRINSESSGEAFKQKGLPCLFLVGTKTDLKEKRVVSSEQLKELAKVLSAVCYETSAKSGHQCRELLDAVVEKVVEKFPSSVSGPQLVSPDSPKKRCEIL